MNRSRAAIKLSLTLLLLFLALPAAAQKRSFPASIHSINDSTIALPDNYPDLSSLRIRLDSTADLRFGSDYTIDTSRRVIILSKALRSILFPANAASATNVTIQVSYEAIPITLPRDFTRHSLTHSDLPDSLRMKLDTGLHAATKITTNELPENRSDFLGNFQKSGSISRGFQAGSNRDLGLTSGFNLQFSGDIAKDVNITGALSEEQTPIQPEGTTQTLNEIDKVFIKIKAGEHFTSTLGDFVLDLNSPANPAVMYQSQAPLGVSSGPDAAFKAFAQSSFDVVSRKLIGAEASAMFREGSVTVAGASPRGQFTTNTFQGQEAVQGPYRLTGKSGERAIIIVAGTEHVYVDGTLQTRGEKNDYVIDYALGEVRFQPRRLITSDSRITIDFEYSTQQYSRSLFATNVRAQPFGDAVQLSATYFREGDNPDAPLDIVISDSDRAILSRAGGNATLAAKSAVTLAGSSSSGRALGSYVRVDTTFDSARSVVYRYDPLDTVRAIYNVSFGYAGVGNGAYARVGIGQYQFVGRGSGDYDTLSYLPLPQLHQVLAFSGNSQLTKHLGIVGEFASSALDPNRFASIASVTDNAYRIGARFGDTMPVLGYGELRASQRRIGLNFVPIDRIQDVDFERRYGNDVSAGTAQFPSSELHREATLFLKPGHWFQLDGGYGSLEHRELEFASTRLFGQMQSIEDSLVLPHLLVRAERVRSQDSSVHEQAVWTRLNTEISKTLRTSEGAFTLGASYADETKSATAFELPTLNADSLSDRSFSYHTIGPFANIRLGSVLSLSSQYMLRVEDSARRGVLTRINNSNTLKSSAALTTMFGLSSTLDVTVRNKHYIDSSALVQNGGDQSTLLLRFEPRYALASQGLSIDAMYEISNERAARLERIFLPVQKGLGAYYYIGDLNGNGRPDPEEFAPARYSDQGNFILITLPTEQLFPTTDLRSNLRLRIAPRELLHVSDSSSFLSRVLGLLSSESYLRIEETSRDPNPNDIYFFRLSHFRTDSSTINGVLEGEQDVNILENDPTQSYRLHYRERRGAAQYNTGLERTFLAERSVRGRFRPSFELSDETTITSTTDEALSDTLSVVRPHSTSQIGGVSDVTYHPIGSALDYGARLEFTQALERSYAPELEAFANAVTLRTSYALESRARIRAEIERDELTLSNMPQDILTLPYSLTNGRAIGVTWLWRLALDYQFGSGIVATVSYDGRNEADPISSGERLTIHNARAEVRANF